MLCKKLICCVKLDNIWMQCIFQMRTALPQRILDLKIYANANIHSSESGHGLAHQREYEDKWQGWQNWTDEKLATKLTKDDQQPVLLLPARWWPDTLPEFESGGWWQRPHKRVRCRQCKCSLVENPSFKSSKCHASELTDSIHSN